jgi:hypothetical protein
MRDSVISGVTVPILLMSERISQQRTKPTIQFLVMRIHGALHGCAKEALKWV